MSQILTKAQKRKFSLDRFEFARKFLSLNGVDCSQISGTHQYRFINIVYMGIRDITIDYYPISERLFNITTQEWDDCYLDDLVFNMTGKNLRFPIEGCDISKKTNNEPHGWEKVSQYDSQHEDKLWGIVFAKIKQHGLNNEVLTILKQNYNISEKHNHENT